MNITEAQYVDDRKTTIKAKVDGEIHFISCDPANTDYANILKLVNEGTLTLKDAD
jgi:hypothetical protein